jgi:branched-chain amino acid aminotransferase
VLSHALHYGTAAFEGVRAYQTARGPAVFRLGDHLRRFGQSARVLGLPVEFDIGTLESACHEVVRRNGLGDCYIRPLAYAGEGSLGLDFRQNPVHTLIAAWPWGPYLGEGVRKGIRLKIVSWAKTSSAAVPSAAKLAGNYVNSCLALIEAKQAGFDEALLLNQRGTVAECSGENVFVVEGDRLTTPPPQDDLLPGITRATLGELAREEGLRVCEQSVTRAQLMAADEVFLTGTAAEVTPVREVDWQPIGEGVPGPVTRRLQHLYESVVRGEWPKFRSWLSLPGGAGGSGTVQVRAAAGPKGVGARTVPPCW